MLRCFKKQVDLKKAIKDMRQVEAVLYDMVHKYERIRKETKTKFAESTKKSRKLLFLKKIKTLDFHIHNCEMKIAQCVHKQYSLEQLEVTKLQIDAIKASTSVFKSFSKYNPIHKIEDLQDTMEELTEELSDVTGLLASGTIEFDEDELLEELRSLETGECAEQMMEELPSVPTHMLVGGEKIAMPV